VLNKPFDWLPEGIADYDQQKLVERNGYAVGGRGIA
jgi:hypothetical protein